MVLAYILSGMTTGGLAAGIWLATGGSLSGALGTYALVGQLAGLAVLLHGVSEAPRH